jgi:beta-glucanase (GH16 family)
MTLRSRRALSAALITAISFFTAACTDNGRDPVLSQIETVPPAPSGPQGNQNISNPTLTIAENLSVSPGDTLTLVWSDEFDAASLDPETWFFATGDGSEAGLPGGWGNAELQYYLPDNAQIENGVLKITARRESIGGLNYTSARINTEDRFAFRYGRIEASIKLPSGQGLWPAFWMLPQDSPYGEWAAKGEIDIVEAVNLDGSNGNEIFATIHYGGEFPANQSSSVTYVPGPDVTEDFHTYALEWDETEIRWYFDDSLYAVQNNWSSTAAPYPAPFDQPFHILLNLAVGGNFPGFAVDSSVFPATMEVDWVRVYSGEEASVPADPGTIPDVVIYATDPNVPVDLVFGVDYTGFDAFGSGSVFDNNVTTDADFNPSFGVTTGNGYGAQVGQFAIVGFAAGFATGYGTLDFKAKGLNNDLIRVKFLDAGDYIDITLSSSSYATDLGNGWYQVSVPLADFTGVDTATGLLFETDNTAASAFQFLLTDFGFSGTAGGGGAGLVTNGDFEAGNLDDWEVFGNGGTIALTAPGSDGTGSAVNLNITVAGNPTLKQTGIGVGTLAPNQPFAISFDWKGTAANGGVISFQVFSEQAGGGVTKTDLVQGGDAFPADWTTVGPLNYTTAADVGGGLTVEITAICGAVAGCVSDLFIDNVVITTP